MSHISMCFVCKVCSGCFTTVSDFLEHKKEKHFAEFQRTKCIVFEEQPLGQEVQDYDSNHVKAFSDSNCNLLTHKNPTVTNPALRTDSSESVKLLKLIKLEVEVDHHPPPQFEPYVLLKRLTKKQLETVEGEGHEKLNQSINSNKKIPKGSSPNNEIAQKSVVKCELVAFQDNNAHESSFNVNAVNPGVKQVFPDNDEYYEEAINTESKLTFDLQEAHSSTHLSSASTPTDEPSIEVVVKKQPRKKRFKCGSCELSFASNSHLNDHQFSHTGIKQYRCNTCDIRFGSRTGLRRHLSAKHPESVKGLKTLHCQHCAKTFFRKDIFDKHTKTHSAERFACPVCSKLLKTSVSLAEHVRRHNNERRFECLDPDCTKAFITSSERASHFKIIHLQRKRPVSIPFTSK